MERKKRTVRGSRGFGTAIFMGVLLALLAGVALLMVLTAIAYRSSDPTSLLLPMGLAALGLTALICGRLCCALWGHDSIIPALVGGGIFAALVAAAGLCIPGSTLTVWMRCAGCPAAFLLAVLGGMVGRKKTKRHRRRT